MSTTISRAIHLPTVHPGLNRELDFNAYTVEPYASHVRQFSPIRGAQAGDVAPRRYREAREDLTTDYFWVFPNWMLNCYPDHVSLNIVLPVETGPQHLPSSSGIFRRKITASRRQNLGRIQRPDSGAKMSPSAKRYRKICTRAVTQRGRFSARQERGVHAFHRMYAKAMKKE